MAGLPSDFVIRPLLPEDLEETLDVWISAWQAAYPSIDFAARRNWAAEHIAALERGGALSRIAVCDGGIAGLLVVNPSTGYLDQIVVATARQGHGVADALLAEARSLSPARLDLHVNQDNARAIAFYKKHGFTISGADVNTRSGAPTHKMSWCPKPG